MASYFLESSALVKRYKTEAGTDFIDGLFSDQNELFYLNLAIIETRKVFYRLWRHPQGIDQPITESEFRASMAQFAHDLRAMNRIEFTDEMIEKSDEILERIWLRSIFDLAQLAAYLIAKEEYPDLIFVCADERSHLVSAALSFVPEDSVIVPK